MFVLRACVCVYVCVYVYEYASVRADLSIRMFINQDLQGGEGGQDDGNTVARADLADNVGGQPVFALSKRELKREAACPEISAACQLLILQFLLRCRVSGATWRPKEGEPPRRGSHRYEMMDLEGTR